MQDISYSAALVPCATNCGARVSGSVWRRPGAWWTGAERVAIAAAVRQARHCALCQARRSALAPAAVEVSTTMTASSLTLLWK